MDEFVLHPLTAQQLERYVQAPSHAMLLTGPRGSGKYTLAVHAAEAILGAPLSAYPYAKIIQSNEGRAIGIEAVREVEHFLSLKVPTTKAHSRIIIIENAQLLTHEAQNALLKTLEEPPEGTLLIMTADFAQNLLPTIRSRVQELVVKAPAAEQLQGFFQVQGSPAADITRAYTMSGGLPGLMAALLSDGEHPLLQATERARILLRQSSYERLLAVDELSKQKQLALDVLFILQQMAHVSLQSATDQAAKKWENILSAAYVAHEQLTNSAQPKLALIKLMLSF